MTKNFPLKLVKIFKGDILVIIQLIFKRLKGMLSLFKKE